MEESFARVETKYVISLAQAEELEAALACRGFSRADFGSPRVQSLYYDTPDHALIRASLARPAYKEKLRVRTYGEPGSIERSFLEIKKKYRGVVYKRRAALSLAEATAGLRQGLLPAEAGQVGREALWMRKRYGLIPSAMISYDRDAWFSPDEPGVRVTFDRNLTYRGEALDPNARAGGLSLLPAGQRLLEIKTGGAYPLWLVRLLSDAGAERTHFSKYGTAYRQYICPEKEGNERREANCSIVFLQRGA